MLHLFNPLSRYFRFNVYQTDIILQKVIFLQENSLMMTVFQCVECFKFESLFENTEKLFESSDIHMYPMMGKGLFY